MTGIESSRIAQLQAARVNALAAPVSAEITRRAQDGEVFDKSAVVLQRLGEPKQEVGIIYVQQSTEAAASTEE